MGEGRGHGEAMPVFTTRSQWPARKRRCGYPHSLRICHGWNRGSSERVDHGGHCQFGISILRAITVEPGTANSIKLEDIAAPGRRRRSAGARAGARRLRHRSRDHRRPSTAGRRPAQSGWCSAMNCSARSRRRRRAAASRPATSSSASCGGPIRCRARPAPPANGTCAATANTPSAASRSCTATAPSASALEPEFAVKVDPALGMLGVLTRAGQRRRQGVGSHRAHRRAHAVLEAAQRARHRRRPGRPAGGADRRAARPRRPCARPQHRRPQAAAGARPRRAPITPATSASSKLRRHRDRMHRRGAGHPRRHRAHGGRRHHLPRRRHRAGQESRSSISARSTARMVLDNDVVFGIGQRQSRALSRRPPTRWRKADKDWLARLITRRVPLARWQEAFENRPDDIKVVIDFTSRHPAWHCASKTTR